MTIERQHLPTHLRATLGICLHSWRVDHNDISRLLKDTNFLKLPSEILNSLNILENEIFVLGDMNINILQNGVNLLGKNVNTSYAKMVISSDVKNYIEFCSTLGLKQLIKVPTRITSSTSTLIDHILTISSEKVVQARITERSLSDHQLIFAPEKSGEENLTNTIILHFAL